MENAQSAGETTRDASREARQSAAKRTPLRIAAAALVVALGFAFVVAVFASNLTEQSVGGGDYIQYWASGRLLLAGANPYDAEQVLSLERASGSSLIEAEVTFSPPPVLTMSLVLGLFTAKNGLILLFAASLASLAASLRVLWQLHGSPNTLLHLTGLLFAPVLACIQAGQISIFFLLGVCLFLLWSERHAALAGAALLPLILKPHLFLPFGVALLLWIVSRKKYGVVAGFLAAVALSSAVPFYLDRDLWMQYTQMIQNAGIMVHFVPSFGYLLRVWIDPRAGWLQFLPEAAGCIWGAWYFWTRRARWEWMDQGLLLLLVSLLCRPYGWFFDEAVLLPAVLTGVLLSKKSGRTLAPIAIAAAAALVELCFSVKVTSGYYLWTAPAWLACYLYATAKTSHATKFSSTVNEH